MTDLLSQADQQHDAATSSDEPGVERRKYRASTLDEAVAEARAEMGPEVELVEAHRVRRGGLGGFFATDLGVEITAVRRVPTPPSGLATPGASTKRIVTGIDKLMETAGAIDAADALTWSDAPAVPAAPVAPSFESQLLVAEHDIVAEPAPSAPVASAATPLITADLQPAAMDITTGWPQPSSSASTPLVAPTELVGRAAPVAPPAPAPAVPRAAEQVVYDNFEFGEDAALRDPSQPVKRHDLDVLDLDDFGAARGVQLAPPSAQLNPMVSQGMGSMDELDALLQGVGIDLASIRVGSAVAQPSATMPLEDVAMLTTAQLVKSVVALDHVPQNVAQVTVSMTTHDGTSVCVAAELTNARHG